MSHKKMTAEQLHDFVRAQEREVSQIILYERFLSFVIWLANWVDLNDEGVCICRTWKVSIRHSTTKAGHRRKSKFRFQALRSTVVNVLANNSIGALVVVSKNGAIEGIVSERDIVRRLSWSGSIHNLTASDVMTKDVLSVTTNVTSSDLMQVMTENKCRHLPIVSGSRLVGMVSIGDVVKRLLEKYNAEVEQMRSFINS